MMWRLRHFIEMLKIKLGLHEHTYATWEHGPDGYPPDRFFAGTAILKNPECHCGAQKFSTKAEMYAYRQEIRKKMPNYFS